MVDLKEEILYIDDEKENLSGFKFVFKKHYKIHLASSATEGWDILKGNSNIKVVITDQRMPKITGVEFLEKVAKEFPKIYRIILTGYTDVQDIIQAINKGKVYQYIRKPWDKEEVKVILDNAINSYNLKQENRKLLENLRTSNAKLEEINLTLEQKVKERTKEIELKNEELKKHRNNLEELVKERTYDLEKAKEKAEESDRLKSAFLANVSHEIRTPMNAIIGFTDLMLNFNYEKQEKTEFRNQIVYNANTLLRLIDDILDISRIEANQINIRYNNYDLNQLFDELYIIFEKQKSDYKKEHIDLTYKVTNNGAPLFIKTDKVRLHQIMANLIGNAIKFTEFGSVSFGYDVSDDKKDLLFYVKDTGIGIPDISKDIIFERFRKAEQSKSKLYRGAGLGLFITKNLVELFEGKIWVESKVNKGTLFSFKIPYLPADMAAVKQKELARKGLTQFDLSGKAILVAEDEDSSYIFIEQVLKDTNVRLIRAKNGKQTVQLFKSKKNIDLILMDMQMPVMDGYQATQVIKQYDKGIPIIAQTAYAMSDQREDIIRAGCDDFLSKPYKPEELLDAIKKYITE